MRLIVVSATVYDTIELLFILIIPMPFPMPDVQILQHTASKDNSKVFFTYVKDKIFSFLRITSHGENQRDARSLLDFIMEKII